MSRNPSISLTDHQQDFVSSLVSTGRYRGVSDVVRAALRLLEGEEEQRAAAIRAVEEAIKVGLASGPAEPMESARQLKSEFRKRRARS